MKREFIAFALLVTAAVLAAVLRMGTAFSVPKTFSVTGIVKNPLLLSLDDLRHYSPVTARLNEIFPGTARSGAPSYTPPRRGPWPSSSTGTPPSTGAGATG